MRVALLISSGGTTAEQIIFAVRSGRLQNIQPALVISSRSDAPGIQKAIKAGITEEDIVILSPNTFKDESVFGEAIIQECEKRAVDFIGQYGWLAKTPANVIQKFLKMMVNQHPGPLDPGRPDFGGTGMYGRRVHAARLHFVRKTNHDFWTEATAQRVAVEFDGGAVLKRKQIPILPDDDALSLQKRLLPFEHEVQIETLADFSSGNVRELGREKPLVAENEYEILEEAKRVAIELFSKG